MWYSFMEALVYKDKAVEVALILSAFKDPILQIMFC